MQEVNETRSMGLKEGSTVHYVHKFDADPSETPNISPAIVVKMKPGRKLNIFVITSNGSFHQNDVAYSSDYVRGTWHRC